MLDDKEEVKRDLALPAQSEASEGMEESGEDLSCVRTIINNHEQSEVIRINASQGNIEVASSTLSFDELLYRCEYIRDNFFNGHKKSSPQGIG